MEGLPFPDAVPQATTVPEFFVLHQNYPNPFNPTTTIRYSIPRSSHVKLRVFNIIGQQVAELVKENQARGNYITSLESGNLASGVYFYRLEVGGFSQTKKMLLMR